MRQSKTEFYRHFVWTTHRRLPLVTPQIEGALYGCIVRVAQKHQCEVVALGGIEDHVHLLVKTPAKYAPSYLMQQIKGGSSAFARERLVPGEFFGWQDGYGGFTVTPAHRNKVGDYVRDQKRHHAENALHPAWEETDEEAKPGVLLPPRPQDA